MKEKEQKIPAWFDGEVYEAGDEVRNPYSGETILLTANELSMYDLIKGAEIVLSTMPGAVNIPAVTRTMRRGLDWFRQNAPEAYMVLLD
jgi:hypothetical protein